MFTTSKRWNKLLACFLAAMLFISNLVALVPVYAADSADMDTDNLTTKQKAVQLLNQLIPYYTQNGKQQGPEWLRTTDINFTFTEDFKPMYSLETLQPFTKEVVDGKFGFWQGRLADQSGSSSTANFGVGLRWLSEDKTSITGINTFYDYAFEHDLSRVGIGAEYFNKRTEFRTNFYIPTSDERLTGTTALADGMLYSYIQAVSGFDYEVGTSLANAPWLSFYATGFQYDNKYKADENGYRLRSKMQFTPRLSVEMGYTDSNLTNGSLYGKVLYQLDNAAGPAWRGGNAEEKSDDISYKLLQKVQRENDIKTETYTKLVAYAGNLSVTVTNNSGTALQGAQVQAYQNGSPVGTAAATDANGIAVLSGLAAGDYVVRADYFNVSGNSPAVTVQKDQTANTAISLAMVGGSAIVHVLDSAGANVGGATVTAEAAGGMQGKSFSGVKTASAAAFAITVVTDATGIARFNNLPPGNYKFTVTYSDQEMKSLAVAVADGSTSNATIVLPSSGGNIVAVISDAVSQAAISGAAVELKSGSTVIDTKTTGSDGTVVFSGLTAGSTYTVTASATNYSDKSINTTVTDKETVAAAIALTPQSGGAIIIVREYPGEELLSDATVTMTVNGQELTATTATNGEATFTNIPSGSYNAIVTKAGYIHCDIFNLYVAGGETRTLSVYLMRQTGDAIITVTDGDNPISGITVSVNVNGEVKTETTNAQGEVTFTSIPAGQYTFTAASDFTSKTAVVTIAADDMARATIALSAMGSVDFIVANGSGPVPGAKISVTVNGSKIDKYSSADGKVSFANLPVGSYTFSVTCTGYESKSHCLTIASNNTANVPLTINKIITAQVNVKDGAGINVWGVSVNVTGNGVNETKTTDYQGKATFSLPAGTYTFTATYINYNDDSKTILISEETSSVNLNIVRKVGDLTLIVKDSKGQPISGAEISESYSNPKKVLGYTGADGKFTLTGVPANVSFQSYYYSATKAGYQGIIQGVTVSEGTNEQEIVLSLLPGKAKVTVKSSTTNQTIQGATVTMSGGSSKTTNIYGYALFNPVPGGEVVFGASMSGYASKTVTATIAPGDGTADPYTEVEIKLTPLDTDATLRITVRDDYAGNPLSLVKISATINDVYREITTAADGIAIFKNVPVGEYEFSFSRGGFASVKRKYSVSATDIGTTVDISRTLYSERGGAWVHVKDQAGNPISDATVSVTIYGKETSANTDSSLGLAVFDNIPAGTHTFTATKADYTSGTIDLQPYSGGTDVGTIVLK